MGAEKKSGDYKRINIESHIQKIAGLMLVELYSSSGPVNNLVFAGEDEYGNQKKIWVNDFQNPDWYRDLLSEFYIDRRFKNQSKWSSRKSRLNSSALNRTKVKQILRGFLRGYSYSRFATAVISYAEQLNSENYYGVQYLTPEEEIINSKKIKFVTFEGELFQQDWFYVISN